MAKRLVHIRTISEQTIPCQGFSGHFPFGPVTISAQLNFTSESPRSPLAPIKFASDEHCIAIGLSRALGPRVLVWAGGCVGFPVIAPAE